MGRSRGGLTTKIHALVDGRGLPIQLHLSEGQASDCREAERLLAAVPNATTFLADKAYDSDAIRSQITAQGGFANIPAKRNRRKGFAFSSFLYRYRNLVERFFGKLKNARGWPPDTTNEAITSSLPSSSSAHAYGSPLMSLRPRRQICHRCSTRSWQPSAWPGTRRNEKDWGGGTEERMAREAAACA